MKPTVFIHTSSHEIVSAKVAMYSHIWASKDLDKFEIKLIQLEDYPHLLNKHGQSCIRAGREGAWYKDVPQSFLPLRFLVPQLMNYNGIAVLTDPDIFAISDIYALLKRDMQGKAILSRNFGGNKGYNSSVMLLDCSKLKHWNWEAIIDSVFKGETDLQDLISLKTESTNTIGSLEEEWNHYDTLTSKTRLLHNTRQITQPWKTGLPFKKHNMDNLKKNKFEENRIRKFFNVKNQNSRRKMLERMKNVLLVGQPDLYQQHPDEKQEKLFLALLKESIDNNFISPKLLRQEVRAGHIRRDIFQSLKAVNYSPVNVVNSLK